MNKIYKLVWSKTRNMYVAVSELAKSHTKSPSGSYMSKTIVAGVLASVISCGAVVPQVYAEVSPPAGSNYVLYDGTDAAKITLQGGIGVGTVIDNVANGLIAAASKEAVNGSQLYALTTRVDNFETSLTTLNTAVAVAQTDINSIKTANITLRSDVNTLQTEVETGFNVNVNGAKVKSVTPTSNYINFKSGNGIVVSNDNNEAVKIALDTNGAVASGNTLAVTGGTAYTELRPASDGNYVATANTTAANLTALDSQLKTTTDGLATEITDRQTAVTNEATARSDADTALGNRIGSVSADGNYIKDSSTKNIAENLGLLDTAVKANADAIAGMTDNDTTYTAGDGLTLTGTEFTAKAGTNVTVDSNGINVAGNGTVATGDTGLVSGGTLYTEVRPTTDGNYIATANSTATNLTALDTQLKTTTDNLATEVTDRTNADTALSDRIGSTASDGNYIKASSTKNVSENLGLLDTAVKSNADAIAQEVTDRQTADTALGARIDGSINGLTVNGQTITYTKGDGTTGTLTTQDTTYTAGDGLILTGTEFTAKAGTNVTVDGNGINVAGNGAVASGDTGLVSGGTLYNEVRPAADGSYIATANSMATNLTVLDTQLKTTTDNLATEVTNRTNADTALSDRIGSIANDGNYIKASADKNIAENLGLLDTAVKANADAIAGMTDNDTTYTAGDGLTLTGTEFTAKAGTNVTVDSNGINVAGNGTVATGDTGLVSGGTLYTEVRPTADGNYIATANSTATNLTALDTQLKTTTDNLATEITDRTNADTALSDRIGSTASDGNYIKASSTKNVSENLGLLDTAVKSNADAINGLSDDKANKDASNVAANTAQWGAAIGTGSVAQNNGELVTGGTVYSALQAQKSDIQTELVGKANVALDNITTAGHNVIKDDAKSVINVTGDGNASVTKTTSAGVDTYKVTVTANGSVAENNADIVSGGTMYTELRPTADGNYITTANTTAGNLGALDMQLKTTTDNLATEVTNRTNADIALSDRIGTITTDGNYIKDSDEKNLSENLGLLDTAVKANADAITANKTHFFGVNSTDDTDTNYDGAGAIGADAIAIGTSATAKSDGSLAIGPAAYAEDEDSIGIGNSITVTNSGTGLGAYSTISGERAIGVGFATVVEGNSAVAIGDSSAVLGNNSTVIGSNANSSASANNGTALGYNADVSASNAVAIGSDSVANAENVVSFGHRKNDAYTGATTGSTYDADLFRRLTNVADGVDSHDVATVGQVNTSLDGKANVNASNIGSNITLPASAYPDGATDEEKATILANAQKTNSEAWGTAIGTGTVANNNSELVTGGSMYVELRPISGNYVSQTNTTAQNLIALDTQVKANANAITANKTHFFGVNSENEYDMNYNGGGATGTNAVAVGPGAWADSENSIAIGNTSATMFGEKAIAIGYLATSLAENAVAVGSSAQAPNSFATAVGSKAVASGWSSTAIGKNANASGKNSIAIGSDSTATGEDEFSIGRPAIEANAETGQQAYPEVKRRLTHVDTGINDTDAVNVKQLTDGLGLKANADASNIGSNLVLPDSAYPDGATDEEKAEILANAQKTNSEAWGTAIGTGTVTANNNELVTGGTLYTEVRPATDGNYITTANSTAMNLGALDSQLKTTTDSLSTEITNRENADTDLSHRIGELNANGAYIRTSNDVSENLTVLDSAVTSKANNDASNIGRNADGQNNASAWGAALGTDILQSGSNILLTSGGAYSELHLSENGNYVDNTKTTAQNIALLDEQLKDTTDLIDALNESAVQYDDATKKKVTLQGGTDGTIIDKVGAGALTASSMEAVNGSQLYAEQQARIEAIGSISADGNYIKKDKNVYENLSLLDTNIRNINATVTDAVVYDSENHNLVTLTGANGTKLTNLKAATLSASSTDAVIGAQLYATNENIAGFATDINRNKENIRNLNTSVSSALSSVSSTSSLVSTLDNLKADTSLTNLSATGRQVITTVAINAVQEYMAAQQSNNNPATPSAPMMYGSNPNTLSVTNAGNGSLYVGEGSNVNGSQSIAIGVGNQVNANNSGAFGDPSIIDADNSYVLGNDDRITSVAKGSFVVGNDSKADAEGSLIFGSNSVSNGKNGVALGNNTVVGGENSVAIGNGSDAMDDNVVSVGNATIQRKIINVANGTIAEDSTDAVTGGQLFETNERVTANENAIATKAEADASNINVSDWATKLGVGKIEEGNTDLVNGGTVFDALKEVKQDSFIQTDGETMTIGANQGGSTINVANNAGEARVITGVATNPNDPTSVANVGYVDAVGTNIMNSVNAGFDKIDTKVNKVGANAAAMASLTPASFEGDEKWSLSAGVGNYRGETAGAVGAFYKPTENVMMNVRGSFGNNENMIGAAVSVSLSKGDVPGLTKRQLARAVNAQASEIQTLKTERANERQVMEAMRYEREQDRQKIAQLEKMVQELAQKVK